jgi:hypothetical protein|nr:MAG TPA: hypothetical protein [Caudoviricetes sp.]DAV03537.1 MAG TPA: hypothetical protein [Caudoviricetes sp.]
MDEQQKNINVLERIVYSLEYHLREYSKFKSESKHNTRQKERTRALDNMFTHAMAIKNELTNSLIYPIIQDGSPYYIQFEDFTRFVESDVPEYIEKIKSYLEDLKNK